MAEVIRNSAIDGVIVTNTIIARPLSLTDRKHSPFATRTMADRAYEIAANKLEAGSLSSP